MVIKMTGSSQKKRKEKNNSRQTSEPRSNYNYKDNYSYETFKEWINSKDVQIH
jgi:hypothetical protein